MSNIQTLFDLEDLCKSVFNQPPPRHGLSLLYWFASENKTGRLNRKPPAYGFHWFNNKNNGVDFLPYRNLQYYEVGNLNIAGAEDLPLYVRKNPEPKYYGERNKDRIIIGVNQNIIEHVFVTEHDGKSNFREDRTFLIHPNLLNQISNMSKEVFLSHMRNHHITQQSSNNNQPTDDSSFFSRCTIL